jgi:hypothetical protein
MGTDANGRRDGDVVAKRWKDLTEGQRRLIIAAGAAETVLKAAMLIDLKRRPARQVRGPKWLWASTALINSAGVLPVAYFIAGRVRATDTPTTR